MSRRIHLVVVVVRVVWIGTGIRVWVAFVSGGFFIFAWVVFAIVVVRVRVRVWVATVVWVARVWVARIWVR